MQFDYLHSGRVAALAVAGLLSLGASPGPVATPTTYQPDVTASAQRTLSSGVYGAPAGTSSAGLAQDGFALSLTANRYRFRMGEGLWFAVELRNVSGTAKSTPLSAKDASYTFTVTQMRSGKVVTRQGTPNFGPPVSYEFAAVTSLFLWFEPQVTDVIEEPGTYTVQAKVTAANHTLRSNLVTLEILPAPNGPPSFAYSDPSSSTAAGPPASGVALSIAKPGTPLRIGSPMWLVIELRNLTPTYIVLKNMDPRSYRLEVANLETGRSLPLTSDWNQRIDWVSGGIGMVGIPKRQSHFGGIRIDQLFNIATPGRYTVRVSISTAVEPMSTMHPVSQLPAVLQSNSLKIDILPARAPNQAAPGNSTVYEDVTGEGPAGPASHGFALGLNADWLKTDLGAPLFIKVELRNVSGRPRGASFGSPSSDYHFQVVNKQTGAVVARAPTSTITEAANRSGAPYHHVDPDTSLYSSFWLNKLFSFTQGGTYSVRVTGHPTIDGQRVTVESNPIDVTFVAPPPRVTLPIGRRVLDYAIRADRPVYVVGQPINVRLTLTNLAGKTIGYDLNRPQPPCILIITDKQNIPIPSSQDGRGQYPLRGIMAWGELPSGETAFAWKEIAAWGYRLDKPGEYTISAKPDINAGIVTPSVTYQVTNDNAGGAAPVTIRILSKDAARLEPPSALDQADLDASWSRLTVDYQRLRSKLEDLIEQLERGVAYPHYPTGNWQDEQRRLEGRVSDLAESSRWNSAYALVGANFVNALSRLGVAGNCTFTWRNGPDARILLTVADYYFGAVQSELNNREARITDAAYPPLGTTRSNCAR